MRGDDWSMATESTTGAVFTKTVKEAWPTLPAASVAEHVTIVVPSGKLEPEAGAHVAGPTPGALSVALAAP